MSDRGGIMALLQGCSKEELLALIRKHVGLYRIEARDIHSVRWHAMHDAADAIADKSRAVSKLAREKGDHAAWDAAQRDFDRAMRLWRKADAYYEKHLASRGREEKAETV